MCPILALFSKLPLLTVVRDQALTYTALWSVNSCVLCKSRALLVFM